MVGELGLGQHCLAHGPEPLGGFVAAGVRVDAHEPSHGAFGIGRSCDVTVFAVDTRLPVEQGAGCGPQRGRAALFGCLEALLGSSVGWPSSVSQPSCTCSSRER